MDPPYSGFVLDPSKCRKLSINEKRELVHELSKWPETAPEKLQAWSRRDLLEILCAEMGKERKYTGVTKQKLIEHLFKVISDKKSGKTTEDIDPNAQLPPTNNPTPSKRQRKTDHPSRLPIETSNHSVDGGGEAAPKSVRHCQNLVCKATLNAESTFCKRCTCGICYKYDENKDPSLWLVCNSDYPYQGDACGMSYHIECVLNHERSGVAKSGKGTRLDGSYYCVYCQKLNDLLACWRKQLMYAKDARRVDTLCQRVSLSHRFLNSTVKYQSLHEIVDTAMKKLESEVGPLNDLSNMARGIVNRLSVGAEVQRLCERAVQLRDSMFLSGMLYQISPVLSSSFIRFEDITSTSLTLVVGLEDNTLLPQEHLGYTLWHRKAESKDYPTEETTTLYNPKRKFLVTNLCSATEYIFRVIAFSHARELGNWEVGAATTEAPPIGARSCESPKTNSSGLSNPSAEGNESNNTPDSSSGFQEKPEANKDSEKVGTPVNSGSGLDEDPNPTVREVQKDLINCIEQNQTSDVPKSDNESNTANGNETMMGTLPVTPLRLESNKPNPSCNSLENGPSKPEKVPGSSSKKSGGVKFEKNFTKDGSSSMEGEYEYCVKVIRWLECEGHIETSFRVKFLTWFSLRASPQERRIVSVYVDTLLDDPGSLAGQLVDTFSEAVCSKRPPPVPNGFCMKLWH